MRLGFVSSFMLSPATVAIINTIAKQLTDQNNKRKNNEDWRPLRAA